jgi:hypothetical protein
MEINIRYASAVLLLSIVSLAKAATPNGMSRCNSVDCVLREAAAAIGGRKVVLNLHTITRSGGIEFYGQGAMGKFIYRTAIVYPSKLREELKGAYVLVDRGTDGNNFWAWSGKKYSSVQDAALRQSMKDTATEANMDALFLTEEYHELKMSRHAPTWAGGSKCLMGKKSDSQDSISYICFDSNTGLITAKGNDGEYRLYDDWRAVSVVTIPFHLTHYHDGKKAYEITLAEAVCNDPIDDSRFQQPKVGQKPD